MTKPRAGRGRGSTEVLRGLADRLLLPVRLKEVHVLHVHDYACLLPHLGGRAWIDSTGEGRAARPEGEEDLVSHPPGNVNVRLDWSRHDPRGREGRIVDVLRSGAGHPLQ